MKKLTVGLAVMAMAVTHSLAVAAQPAAMLDRAASPVSDAEGMGGGAGIWAVIAALAIGIGAIVLIEDQEEDIPSSP